MTAAAVAEAPVETPQVDPKVAEELGARVLDARQRLGASRRVLSFMSGLTQAAIWRIEDGRPRPEEIAPLTEALDKVARDEVPEILRRRVSTAAQVPSKAELLHRMEVVAELLRQARSASKAAEKNGLLDQALLVLDPPAQAAEEPAE